MEAGLRTQPEAGGKEPTCAHRQDQGLLFVGLSSGEDPPHTTPQQHLRMVWALLPTHPRVPSYRDCVSPAHRPTLWPVGITTSTQAQCGDGYGTKCQGIKAVSQSAFTPQKCDSRPGEPCTHEPRQKQVLTAWQENKSQNIVLLTSLETVWISQTESQNRVP